MHNRNTLFRAILVIFGGILCAASAWPQEPAFRIDSYIPQYFTDFQWRFEGYFSAEGYRRNETFKGLDGGGGYMMARSEDRQSIDILTDVIYRYETVPRFFSLTFRGAYKLDHTNPPSHQDDSSGLEPGFFPAVNAGYYLYSNFLAFVSGSGGWMYTHNLHNVNPDIRAIEYTADVEAGVGWGRAYDGRFAATALYIVDELKSDGVLGRMPTFGEMDSLTEIIYARRLESYDDFRLHQIASLQSIMNFLESKGIISPVGPYGYLLIQDVWNYFPNDARRFGWMAKAGIGIDYFHRLSQKTDEHVAESGEYVHEYEHYEREIQQPFFFVKAEYFKPLTLRWQINASLEWQYYFNKLQRDLYFDIFYSPSLSTSSQRKITHHFAPHELSIYANIVYIFDSRTSASFAAEYTRSHFNSETYHFEPRFHGHIEYTSHLDLEDGIFRSEAAVEYRITIPTTLRVGLQFMRRDAMYREIYPGIREFHIIDYYEYFTSVRLIHYLF